MMDLNEKHISQVISLLGGARVAETLGITDVSYKKCDYKCGAAMPGKDGFVPFAENARWGDAPDEHYWFLVRFALPKKYAFCKLRLRCDTTPDRSNDGWNVYNPQFIVYKDGKALQGLDTYHRDMELEYAPEYELFIYAYTGSMGHGLDLRIGVDVIDERAESLYFDMLALFKSALVLEKQSKEYADIISALEGACRILDLRDVTSARFRNSVCAAGEYINAFYAGRCGEQTRKVVCLGHTHIDVAWLWTLAQTREKAQHTFSTVLALMDKYPEFTFMSSQPQLLKYVKQEDGALYERIKQRVKEGRFELEGAMWLEADCNIPSGESLVRQIVHGKRFLKEEFGIESHILWLPDVFGYAASLPQICRKAGVDIFVTSKISWNDTNRMPHDVFEWKGIDGTGIFTYFLTAQEKRRGEESPNYTTYVATPDPEYLAGCFDRFTDKSLTDTVILTMGWGDGGGGPSRDMCETARRMSKGIPGIPQAVFDHASPALEKIKNSAEGSGRLPVWEGELYLEYHRGTYTSVARNKRYNRKAEFANKNAELFSLISHVVRGAEYPERELYENWETLLLNQFHDIIPGSCIPEVYELSRVQYEQLLGADTAIISHAKELLTDSKRGYSVFNPTLCRSGLAKKDDEYCYVPSMPQAGYGECAPVRENAIKTEGRTLESAFYKAVFDENGYICSLYDRSAGREVSAGVLGGFEAYEDRPVNYDCWNLEYYHEEKPYAVEGLVSFERVDRGAGAGFRTVRRFMDSEITQEIIFFDTSRRIDFVTRVDWKEKDIILKAVFDADVNNDDAAFDIQYGFIRRPAHRNTSWDAAKFETCGQKYADISDGGYGIAVLNDCKYGYSARRGRLMLSLIKASGYPNSYIDDCVHEFTYSLLAHEGDFRSAGVIEEATLLNDPPEIYGRAAVGNYSLITCDAPNITLGAAKKAYGSDDAVIRLAESRNMRTIAHLAFGFDVKEAYLCDLNENEIKRLDTENGKLALEFRPFEIHTIKLRRK